MRSWSKRSVHCEQEGNKKEYEIENLTQRVLGRNFVAVVCNFADRCRHCVPDIKPKVINPERVLSQD